MSGFPGMYRGNRAYLPPGYQSTSDSLSPHTSLPLRSPVSIMLWTHAPCEMAAPSEH